MRTNIFPIALAALIIGIAGCFAGCKEKKGDVPSGMHEVTYQGFTFLCPDQLKPAENLDGMGAEPNIFTLSGMDIANAIICSVEDKEAGFTAEAGKQSVEEIKAEDPKAECTVLDDGVVIKMVVNDPNYSAETIYTATRICFKGKKACNVSFTYTEKNKEALSKYVDAVMNSVKPVE